MCWTSPVFVPNGKKLVLSSAVLFFFWNDLSDFHGKGTRSFQGSNTHPDSTLYFDGKKRSYRLLLYYLISELHHLLTLKLVSFCSSCPGSPTTIIYRLVYTAIFHSKGLSSSKRKHYFFKQWLTYKDSVCVLNILVIIRLLDHWIHLRSVKKGPPGCFRVNIYI